jgi:hypothetical protein
MILALREDRGSPERAHDDDGGQSEEFIGERREGALVSEDGEVSEVSQGTVGLEESKTRLEMEHRGLAQRKS